METADLPAVMVTHVTPEQMKCHQRAGLAHVHQERIRISGLMDAMAIR